MIPGQMLGQDRPEKNSVKMFNSKRRDSESSTDIDPQNLRLRHESERDALFRGSDPPSGHIVHTTVGDMWRAPTRRLIRKHSAVVCRKQTTKKYRSLSDRKK